MAVSGGWVPSCSPTEIREPFTTTSPRCPANAPGSPPRGPRTIARAELRRCGYPRRCRHGLSPSYRSQVKSRLHLPASAESPWRGTMRMLARRAGTTGRTPPRHCAVLCHVVMTWIPARQGLRSLAIGTGSAKTEFAASAPPTGVIAACLRLGLAVVKGEHHESRGVQVLLRIVRRARIRPCRVCRGYSGGIVDEPVFLGRRWGVGHMWAEAAVYAAVSLALGYAGWISKTQTPQHESTMLDTIEHSGQQALGSADQQSQLVKH